MMRHVADLNEAKMQGGDVYEPGLVQLLYSAKSDGELIFKVITLGTHIFTVSMIALGN